LLNRHVRRPDLTIVLDVSPEIAAERRASRGDAAQLYDQSEVQRALALFYRNLPLHMPNDHVVVIDATGSLDEVQSRIWGVYADSFS